VYSDFIIVFVIRFYNLITKTKLASVIIRLKYKSIKAKFMHMHLIGFIDVRFGFTTNISFSVDKSQIRH